VEPVLGLVEDDRARIVEHGLLNLLARVRRQAVHEEGVGLGGCEQAGRDGVRAHPLGPGAGLALLPHARPDVRVDDVGARDRPHGVGRELEVGRPALGCQLRPDVRLGLEPLRARERDSHAEQARPEDPGVRHVEARVAKERDLAAPERGHEVALRAGPALGGAERVGIDLAGVQEVREPVHHGDRGRGRKALHLGMVVRPDDDAVDEAREDARRVLD